MNYTDLFIDLFDKGEWKAIIISLILAFSITYIIKIFYFSFVDKKSMIKIHIRLIALFSGFLATALYWPIGTLSLKWYSAGILIGPLSIFVYHVLSGVVSLPIVNKRAPFLKPLIKGYKE